MPRKRNNPVLLSAEDRDMLEGLIASGHAQEAHQLTHARILLKADEGEDAPDQASWPDTKIADALEVSRSTVARVRQRFAWEGLEAALVHRRPNQGHQTEEARWRAGGALDRSGLLGASKGQKALEFHLSWHILADEFYGDPPFDAAARDTIFVP